MIKITCSENRCNIQSSAVALTGKKVGRRANTECVLRVYRNVSPPLDVGKYIGGEIIILFIGKIFSGGVKCCSCHPEIKPLVKRVPRLVNYTWFISILGFT